MENIELSIVVLTYKRPDVLERQIKSLLNLSSVEIIVVENYSENMYATEICKEVEVCKVLSLDKNYGAVGRNFGMMEARGNYIITLDDDVIGLTNKDIETIKNTFLKDSSISAICFKVIDDHTREVCNWCHPRNPDIYSDQIFETCEISEGAVAFRKYHLTEVGLYPEEFFISHEGLDLALRLIKSNKKIIYSSEIEVFHEYSEGGRKSWRRYYYDLRNLIWIYYRHYPVSKILSQAPLKVLAMFIYSARDGFLSYFFKAIWDAFPYPKKIKGTRYPLSRQNLLVLKEINKLKPSIFYYIKRRLLKKGVKI